MTLTLNNISFRYTHNRVLNCLSVDFEPGKYTLITGENGSGKSTLLRVIAGVLTPQNGEIIDSGKIRENTGYLTDQPPLYDLLTVEEQIRFYEGIYQKKIDPSHFDPVIQKKMQHSIATLSRGMKQRVALSILFGLKQKLYLIDEGFSGVDQQYQLFYREQLRSLVGDGAVVIEINHQQPEADEIYRLDRGRLCSGG